MGWNSGSATDLSASLLKTVASLLPQLPYLNSGILRVHANIYEIGKVCKLNEVNTGIKEGRVVWSLLPRRKLPSRLGKNKEGGSPLQEVEEGVPWDLSPCQVTHPSTPPPPIMRKPGT